MLSLLIIKVLKFVRSCNFSGKLYKLSASCLRSCECLKSMFRIVALTYKICEVLRLEYDRVPPITFPNS